jgi:prophage regulatory protein
MMTHSPISTILRLPAVLARTGLARATIYAHIAQGSFPAPIKLGPRASGWVEAEVEGWVAARIAAR